MTRTQKIVVYAALAVLALANLGQYYLTVFVHEELNNRITVITNVSNANDRDAMQNRQELWQKFFQHDLMHHDAQTR